MKAIQWKKADAGAAKKYFTQSKLKPGKTYQAHYENMNYYLQDYLEEEVIMERQLVVLNDHNEKIFEKTITTADSDGAELSRFTEWKLMVTMLFNGQAISSKESLR
jgi:hypothetical protein